MINNIEPPESQGVRKLSLRDQLPNPDVDVLINVEAYKLEKIVSGKSVLDIGCGYGRNRKIVENLGGSWIGLEPFDSGENIVVGFAEDIPFPNESFDVVIMHAVLEHVKNPVAAFNEVSRVLKPGGLFVGYVAFMECFHEISYCHMSHMAVEEFASSSDMKLERISGGTSFGIDYHTGVMWHPLPGRKILEKLITIIIRTIFKVKSIFAYFFLRIIRKNDKENAKSLAKDYYKLLCLKQSVGFDFLIKKKIT